jgi:spermidine/putrescine-binding protein
MEINVNEFVKGLLDSKLNADLSRRRFIQGATGLVTLTVLGSPLDAFAADVGGELNYFGWDGENGANVAKDFLAKNKIQMQASFQVSGDEALTRFNTGGRGTLDILTPNKDFQRAILAAGTELFQPLDMSRIPNAAGLFPAFKNASWLIKDGKTYAVPLIWGDEPCVYNPKKWDGVPAKYTDFADPKYKGEIVFMDDPFGNIWLFAKSVGVADPSRLTAAQLQQAVDAMLKVKPNIVTIGASFADMADVMVRGDASIGVCGWAYQTLIAKDKGVELKVASPADDGTHWMPTPSPPTPPTSTTPTPSSISCRRRSRTPQLPPSSAPAAPTSRPSISSTR